MFGEDPYENADVLTRICFVAEGQPYPDSYRVCHVSPRPGCCTHWDEAFARQLLAEYDLPLGRRVRKLSRGHALGPRRGRRTGVAGRADVLR